MYREPCVTDRDDVTNAIILKYQMTAAGYDLVTIPDSPAPPRRTRMMLALL
jgi:hypothetical protein